MTRLKQVLTTAIAVSDKMGGSISVKATDLLKAHRRRQFAIFVVLEVIIVLLIVACAWYLIVRSGDLARMKAVAGLLGVGSGGCIEVARRVWKEWAQTDLALSLMSEASEAQVKALIERLLKAL